LADNIQIVLSTKLNTTNLYAQIAQIQTKLQSQPLILNANINSTKLNNVNTSLKNMSTNVKEVGKSSQLAGEGIGSIIGKFSLWFGVSTLVVSVIHSFKNMVTAVTDVNDALVENNKILDLTIFEMKDLTDQAFELGKQLGQTGSAVLNATADFARMGYTAKEALNLASQAIMLMNIGDGITSVEQATSGIIATLKGFNFEASETTRILDVLNEVSNNYAVDTGGLVEGIKRISATMDMSNNSFEESMAMLTSASEVLQSTEKASTGIIILTQRMRSLNEEGNNLGKTFIPKLQEAFKTIANVDIMDKNGLRSTYDILVDTSKIWKTLTDEQRQYLGELAAGKRQIKVFNAIMQNEETLVNAVTTALTSQGSAYKENIIYLDSITGKTNIFKATVQELWNNTLNAETVKNIVDFGTSIVKLVDILGLLNIIIASVLTYLIGIKTAIGASLIKALATLGLKFTALSGVTKVYTASTVGAVAATKALQAALSFGLAVAITAVIAGITHLINKQIELARTTKENQELYKQQAETYNNNKSEINKLVKEYEILADKTERTNEEEQDFIDIQNQLSEILPSTTAYIDAQGNAHLKTNIAIRAEIDLLNQLVVANKKVQQYEFIEKQDDIKDNYNDIVENLQNNKKKIGKIQKEIGVFDFVNKYYDNNNKVIDKVKKDQYETQLNEIEFQNIAFQRQLADYNQQFKDYFIERAEIVAEQTNQNQDLDSILSDMFLNTLSLQDVDISGDTNIQEGMFLKIGELFGNLQRYLNDDLGRESDNVFKDLQSGFSRLGMSINDIIENYNTLQNTSSENVDDITLPTYSELYKELQHKLKMDKITLKKYYSELSNLREQYKYDLSQEDLWGVDEEIYELGKEIDDIDYDTLLDSFNNFYDGLNHQLTMGIISEENYFEALSLAYLDYINLLKNEDLIKIKEELYKGQLKLSEEAKDKMSDTFSSEYNTLSHLRKMDKINTEEYYNKLKELYEKYVDVLGKGELRKYLEELYNLEIELHNEQLKLSEEAKDNILDIFNSEYSTLSHLRKMDKINTEEYYEKLKELYNQYVDVLGKGELRKYLEELYNLELDFAKELEEQLKENQEHIDTLKGMIQSLVKQNLNDQIDALKKITDAYEEQVNLQKKLLDLKEEERDYNKDLADKEKNISKINQQLIELSLDDSREAQVKKLELEDERAKLIEEKEEFIHDRQIDIQKDALDTSLDNFKDTQDKKVDVLEEKLNNAGYIAEEVNSLLTTAISDNTNTLYNNLILWNELYGDGINNTVVSAWENAMSAMNMYKNSLPSDTMTTGVLTKMQQNSDAWFDADPIEKNRLHEENLQLGSAIGATYNSNTGKYYKEGVPLYDNGGMATEPQLVAIGKDVSKEEPEWFLRNNQLNSIIQKAVLSAKNLKTNFTVPKIPFSNFQNASTGEIHIDNLMTIYGNVDEKVIPKIKQEANRIAQVLNDTLNKKGIKNIRYS